MPEPAPHHDEQQADLVAYLDGELDEGTARDVEQRLQRDAALRIQADGLKRTWELLDFLPQPEPSAMFTSRTLDKIAVLRPTPSRANPIVSGGATTPPPAEIQPAPTKRRWAKQLVWAAAALMVFGLGFWSSGPLVRKSPLALDPAEREEQMAKDLRVLDNLNLYQYADDLNFLFGLDQPDLFGDDGVGR